MDGSTSLNAFKNLSYLIGDSPEELQEKLVEIKTPFNLLGIYSYKSGNAHIAWINLDRPLIKMKVTKKEK